MINLEIKKVLHNDVNQLQKISKQTFNETFSLENTEANMRKWIMPLNLLKNTLPSL